jgi:hypothetical protein
MTRAAEDDGRIRNQRPCLVAKSGWTVLAKADNGEPSF